MRAAAVLVAAVALAIGSGRADARERLVRVLDARNGLPTASVYAVAQDRAGFIWIGTIGGLLRYDGHQVRRIAPETIHNFVDVIRADRDGSVIVREPYGVWRVAGEVATAVAGPDGQPLGRVRDFLVASDGSFWVVTGGAVWRRAPGGAWTQAPGVVDPALVREGPRGVIHVGSPSAIWRLGPGAPEQLTAVDQLVDFLVAADGSVVVLEWFGRVFRVAGAVTTELTQMRYGSKGLVQRGDVVWAGSGVRLAAIRPGEPVEFLDRDDQIPNIDALFVDAEGGLWIGSQDGLLLLPEPETATWTPHDELPGGPRFFARTAEGLWVTGWNGMTMLDLATGAVQGPVLWARHKPCVDGGGRLWAGLDEPSFAVREAGAFRRYPRPADLTPPSCAADPDGSVWFGTAESALFRARDGHEPERVPAPAMPFIFSLHRDRQGRLWLGGGERACWADATRPLTTDAWTCRDLGPVRNVTDIEESDRGDIWLSTEQGGVLRWTDDGVVPIPASQRLASRAAMGLQPSPRGGLWVVGHGFVLRVHDRPDLDGGWEVVEDLGAWHGLASVVSTDIFEETDGSVWLTSGGVTRVPASVRALVRQPPRVALIDARVDGAPVSTRGDLELPYRRNRLELRFSALSYRDPMHLTYRVRLHDDAAWSEPTSDPTFRFVDLPPGDYRVSIAASLDGATWSSAPPVLRVRVLRPWWRHPYALAAAAALILLVLYALHRLRLALSLRLERQRARIAMDLHDEIGSGLGAIGILAGAAGSLEDVPEPRRRAAAAKIADTAAVLGASLGDIVWSLRRGSSTLDALAAHIAERAGQVFSGDDVTLAIDLPERVPALPLSLPVCRNLQLVAFEALHNASRHATARTVTFGLRPAGRRAWRMWIEDDGVGMKGGREGGLGLTTMRRRAEEIGARLRLSTPAGGGTRVELEFAPRAGDRRLDRDPA